MNKDLVIDLDAVRSAHAEMFAPRREPWFAVVDAKGRAVNPAEIGVLWEREGNGDWRLIKVDVKGRRYLRTGGLGNDLRISVFDLAQFPDEVVDQINARRPTPESKVKP